MTYYDKNREKYLEQSKKYYRANREKCLAYQREYSRKNPDKIKKYNDAYHMRHKLLSLSFKGWVSDGGGI